MLICGDFFINENNLKNINIDLCFKDIEEVLDRNEFRIINLEAPILKEDITYEKNPKIGPNIFMNEGILNLINNKFNICTLANNHIMDYCAKGVINTINCLEENSIEYIGVKYKNQDLISKVFNYKNKKVGVIIFAENEFLKAPNSDGGVLISNYDCISNYYDISNLRKNVDYLLCIYHGGNEHINLPSPEFVKRTKFLVDIGCDVVICHHAHITSGHLKYNNCDIFFGLGNFVFDSDTQRLPPHWYKGLMIEIDFSDSLSFNLLPVKYDKEYKKLYLLKNEEKEAWFKEFEGINLIIKDEILLNNEFSKLLDLKLNKYQGFLEVIGNKHYQKLVKYNLVPSVFKKYKILMYENLIRNETHRENVLKFLYKRKKINVSNK